MSNNQMSFFFAKYLNVMETPILFVIKLTLFNILLQLTYSFAVLNKKKNW